MKVTTALLVLLAASLGAIDGVRKLPQPEVTQGGERVTVLTDVDEVEDTPKLGARPPALTTVLTHLGKEEKRLFSSIALVMPGATVFVACTTNMVDSFKSLDAPTLTFTLAPILDKFKGLDRHSMSEKGMWVEFNEKRIDILRLALREGHNGAWYMDGDTFLLAPLPQVEASVGLSRHRIDRGKEATFGEWNSGYIFFRSFDALETWKRASQALNPSSQIHQTTLREVAEKYSNDMVELGCSVNVGGFRMDPLISEEFKPYYDQVQCKDGIVQFRNCPITSGHWHVGDKNGLRVRPYMESALRDCEHPLLKTWLESY